MGANSSKKEYEMDLLQQHLNKFLETHCEMDSNSYVMYNDIIAHFYTYLGNHNMFIIMNDLNNLFFDLVKNTLTNKYETSLVRRQGVSLIVARGHSQFIPVHNYSYIHGLKLTKSVHSV